MRRPALPALLALAAPALFTVAACSRSSREPADREPAAPPATPGTAAVSPDRGAAVATGPAAATTAAAATAPVGAPDAAVAATPPVITREARARYREQLAAGRKLAKAASWSEAIIAFEAALVAVPGDDRALSELSWAAMSAGDAMKARDAGRQAVLATTEPDVKAAALYNLGRVEELATPSLAAKLYRESLALRPDKLVERRLASLAKVLPEATAPTPLPCTTPMTRAQLCACLGETSELAPADRRCVVTDTGVAGLGYATYARSGMGEEGMALVAGAGDRWQVIAELATVYNPGAFGIMEDWKLVGVSERAVGERQVLEVRTSWSRRDIDGGINEVEQEERDRLVVCVRERPGAVPACPLDVTLRWSYERDILMDELSEEEKAELAAFRTDGLPIKTDAKVAVEVGDDGVARIRAVEGRLGGEQLGDRKLW